MHRALALVPSLIVLALFATLAAATEPCITVVTTNPDSWTQVDSFYQGGTPTAISLRLAPWPGNYENVDYYNGSSWVSMPVNTWVTGSKVRLTVGASAPSGTYSIEYDYTDPCDEDDYRQIIVIVI